VVAGPIESFINSDIKPVPFNQRDSAKSARALHGYYGPATPVLSGSANRFDTRKQEVKGQSPFCSLLLFYYELFGLPGVLPLSEKNTICELG
jgi:hypothetical protein